jgi:rubrerythrin
MIGDGQQYLELAARYREYGDIELQELAVDAADLTEPAQQALAAEMQSRNLSPKVKEAPKRERPVVANQDKQDMSSLRDFAALAPDECVWEFPLVEDAAAASRALAAEGVQSVLIQGGTMFGDMRPPRLVVGPLDVERADQILSRPIAAEFRDAAAEEDTYSEPVCSVCSAAEPLLEAVDPVNQWRCESCGHVWVDALADGA